MPPLDAADGWVTVPSAPPASAHDDGWITVPAAAKSSASEFGEQSLAGAGLNAVGQGVVSGTGSIVAGTGRQLEAYATQGTQKQLATMDAIDQGKEVPQDQDVIGYQFLSPEQRTKARADFTQADADLSKREPNALIRVGTTIQEASPKLFPVDPEQEGHVTGVGRMVGGVGPLMAAGAMGGPVGMLTAAAALGAQAYDSTYQEAIAKGAPPKEAEDAAGKSALGQMSSMALPIGRALQIIPVPLREGFLKTVANLGMRGVELSAGNTAGTLAQNYVASQTYDPDRPLLKGAGDAGIDGMIAGMIIHAPTAIRSAAAITKIGSATDIDGAISAAGDAAKAPSADAAATTGTSWWDLFRRQADNAAPAASPIPKTSAEAKTVASAYYQKADRVGGTLVPDFTNKFIDKAESIAPQTAEGRAIAGDTAITGLVDRIQALRDGPISLRGAQEIDERLGDLIDKEYGLKGLSKDGHNLLDLQTTFRNMIMDAGPADTTNGTQGFEAIKQGRAAWAQAMKMMDFERILNRAEQTDNPVTSIRAGIRALTSNPARSRGYSPEEISALKDAANRGALGSVLHVFGSRLTPLAVGAAGLSTGIIPGLIGAGLTHGATSLMRSGATALQMRRADNAMSVLGAGVPPTP